MGHQNNYGTSLICLTVRYPSLYVTLLTALNHLYGILKAQVSGGEREHMNQHWSVPQILQDVFATTKQTDTNPTLPDPENLSSWNKAQPCFSPSTWGTWESATILIAPAVHYPRDGLSASQKLQPCTNATVAFLYLEWWALHFIRTMAWQRAIGIMEPEPFGGFTINASCHLGDRDIGPFAHDLRGICKVSHGQRYEICPGSCCTEKRFIISYCYSVNIAHC